MNNRMKAIYGRQSVDKKDSISIESQIEFCQYELRGESCKEYTDKGYSGKNTDRPMFQAMIRDIEQGLISKVVVYKLDRISRSIIDFANMMELFPRYNVEFVSATEKFDTSTPMGRAMLNICIVFAQLERETIQKRVTDAYYSRCQRGFHMGGQTPYGFNLEPTVVDGIRTKMMAADPEAAERIKLIFEKYAKPQTTLGDLARYLTGEGIGLGDRIVSRPTLSNILRSPVYAQADLELYDFFNDQSYMLGGLENVNLPRIVLPLGKYSKAEVRTLARELALNSADTPDSMDVCFIPGGDYAGFIERRTAPPPQGNFVSADGEILGRHGGIHSYTVGQRRGLNIALGHRIYVAAIDPLKNEVVLAEDDEIMKREIHLESTNYLVPEPKNNFDAIVRVRHSRTLYPARVYPGRASASIEFVSPIRAPAPGQTAVFYRDDGLVIGAGVIV